MNDTNSISMKDVRRDLPGFLRRIAEGQKLTVIYHSQPLVTVQSASPDATPESVRQNMQDFLQVAAQARAKAKHSPDPAKSYKQLYNESESRKHGLS